MEIAQLMSAMNMVEVDHQLVLEKLRVLNEALGGLTDPKRDVAGLVKKLQDLNQSITSRFAAHVAQQEIELFPFLGENLPEEPELVAALRGEHEHIKNKSAEMSNCLKVALELEEGIPRAVLWDILAYGWELWELLDSHAHRETRAIGQCFTKFLQTVPGM